MGGRDTRTEALVGEPSPQDEEASDPDELEETDSDFEPARSEGQLLVDHLVNPIHEQELERTTSMHTAGSNRSAPSDMNPE